MCLYPAKRQYERQGPQVTSFYNRGVCYMLRVLFSGTLSANQLSSDVIVRLLRCVYANTLDGANSQGVLGHISDL